MIVGVRGNVRERIIAAFGFGAACGAPQEGDDLTARAALIGTEFSCGGAARDPVFDRPENRLVEIRALGNVSEAEVILRRIAVEREVDRGRAARLDAALVKAAVRQGKVVVVLLLEDAAGAAVRRVGNVHRASVGAPDGDVVGAAGQAENLGVACDSGRDTGCTGRDNAVLDGKNGLAVLIFDVNVCRAGDDELRHHLIADRLTVAHRGIPAQDREVRERGLGGVEVIVAQMQQALREGLLGRIEIVLVRLQSVHFAGPEQHVRGVELLRGGQILLVLQLFAVGLKNTVKRILHVIGSADDLAALDHFVVAGQRIAERPAEVIRSDDHRDIRDVKAETAGEIIGHDVLGEGRQRVIGQLGEAGSEFQRFRDDLAVQPVIVLLER